MKLKSFFVLSFALSVACGGTPSSNSAVANQSTLNANTDGSTNSNPTLIPYNGVQNLNPNSANAGPNQNIKVVPYKPKEGELPYGSRTAPDDSIVSTASRGKEFVETRTFKNHPVLAKVEKILGGTETKYKVYLKNGKVLDGPADKLDNMASLAPETILAAVGIVPPAPAANSAVPKDAVKKP